MYLSHLALDNFRSYSHLVVEFEKGVNALIGFNGQGKTNLVEAIAYLATFSSHRVAADAALVKAGESAAVIRAKVQDRDRTSVVEMEILQGRANRARLNRNSVSTRDILGVVHCIVFAPEDLVLVKGEPADRRRFLDSLLVQLTPRMAAVKSDYDRVLRQRGATLKSVLSQQRSGRRIDLSTLDVWDAQVAKLGAEIVVARERLVRDLEPIVAAVYRDVSNAQSAAEIRVKSSLESDGTGAMGRGFSEGSTDVDQIALVISDRLAENRKKEIERGTTLVGPHRDELTLTLDGLLARSYASHGESWSLALALRLASYELLRVRDRDAGRSAPILILDDVFAELDSERRESLAAMVHDADQVFITAAVANDVPSTLAATTYQVHDSIVELQRDDKRF